MSTEEDQEYTGIATPVVGIDGINQAIRALYAYNRPATYKDLAAAANLNPIYLSQALSSSRDAGLTRLAGKRGLYEPTSEGENYARLLSFGKDAECRDLMQRIILKNPLWSETTTFLKINEGQPRDAMDLVLDVETKLGKRWKTAMRGKIASAFTSILEYAGLIKIEQGKVVSKIGLEAEAPSTIEKPEREMERKLAGLVIQQPPPTDFAEFSIPDSFIVYVRKNPEAIEFFKKQVREDSVFVPWIQFVKEKVVKVSDTV